MIKQAVHLQQPAKALQVSTDKKKGRWKHRPQPKRKKDNKMKSIFTVFYKADSYNPNRTYFQNQNRYARSKCFTNRAEAEAFAKEVNGRVYQTR